MDPSAIRATEPRPADIRFLEGFESFWFRVKTDDACMDRQVFALAGPRPEPAPTVILVHEIPVINERTVRLARRFRDAGYAVVLPSLIGPPTKQPSLGRGVTAMARLCIAGEFAALSTGRTGPIVDWLRALADHVSGPASPRGVGVVGMCFSGGFALGTIANPNVGAAVASQPAVPLPIWFDRLVDLGMSPADLLTIRQRVGRGQCLRALRYAADWKSPRSRFRRLCDEFPDLEAVTIPTSDRRKHSVLGDAIDNPADCDLAEALAGTVAFLDRYLKPGPRPAAGNS